MKFIIGLVLSIQANILIAHSPNEASFFIFEKDSIILVEAEFTWSLGNAVFIFDSSLTDLSTAQDIQNTLFNYINEQFVLTDKLGNKINLLKVTEIKNQSHHEEYQLVFEKKQIAQIKNSLLFNFSKKQKNFHQLFVNGEKREFYLTEENPIITFELESNSNYYLMSLAIFFGFIIFLLLRRKRAKV